MDRDSVADRYQGGGIFEVLDPVQSPSLSSGSSDAVHHDPLSYVGLELALYGLQYPSR